MFGLIKFVIWVAGLVVVAYFVLGYFGYEFNREFITFSREKCEEKLKQCAGNVIRQGTDNVKCDFKCVDRPGLIIKKK